jgi:hypothetical protein
LKICIHGVVRDFKLNVSKKKEKKDWMKIGKLPLLKDYTFSF